MITQAPSPPKLLEKTDDNIGSSHIHCVCPPSHRRAQRVLFSIVAVLLLVIAILGLYIHVTG
jgi:hypothetical protein